MNMDLAGSSPFTYLASIETFTFNASVVERRTDHYTYFLVIDSVLGLTTVLANSVFLAALIKQDETRGGCVVNALIINLASSDLFHGAVSIPLAIIPHYGNPALKQNDAVCFLSILTFQYSVIVSVLTMFTIAIERYVVIVHPLGRPAVCCMRAKTKLCLIALLWLYPLLLLILLVTTHSPEPWTFCEASQVLSSYHDAVLAAQLVAILCIATTLYIRIVCTVRRSSRTLATLSRTPSTIRQRSEVNTVSPHEIELLKTVALLMVIFYLCFLPTALKIVLFVAYGSPMPEPYWLDVMEDVNLTFLCLSACLDPIIYGWRNSGVRMTIRKMLSGLKPQRSQKETGAMGNESQTWCATKRSESTGV